MCNLGNVFREHTSLTCFDTDINLYAVPGAPVAFIGPWKKVDYEFCFGNYFIVVDISVACQHISLLMSVWRLQHVSDCKRKGSLP